MVIGDGEDDDVGESLLVCKTDLGYFYHKQMLVASVMMATTVTFVRGVVIYVGDLIVGDVGRGDYENVACFDDHKKT